MSQERTYFETFDAFRFFAFFLVFISHIPLPGFDVINLFQSSGGTGVTFFFVLSGFLISYMLMHEKLNSGKLDFKKFFARRVLRIWPLFYLMLAFAFATPYILDFIGLSYSNEGYEPNWLMSCLFLENYQMIITDSFPNASPMRVMWSLCVEEHFYILWGILFSILPLRATPWIVVGSILVANISRFVFMQKGWVDADLLTNIDYFGYGTAAAYILLFRKQWIDKLSLWPMFTKYGLALLTLGLVFLYPNINYYFWVPALSLGVLFSLLILFTLPKTGRIYIPQNNLLSRLGLYTYGLYLYHTIIINLFLQLMKRQNLAIDTWLEALIFFLLALLATVLISMASYYFFEKPFIRMKKYFYPKLKQKTAS